jgi:hypothetical protein
LESTPGGFLLTASCGSFVGGFVWTVIAKEGDGGEIFTGIGRVGRTHRLRWSEFSGVGDRDVAAYSSGRFSRTNHYVGLSGTSKEYKFGAELTDEQRAFVITFLHEHVFGSDPPLTRSVMRNGPV